MMSVLVPSYNSKLSMALNTAILISGGLVGYFGLKQDSLFFEVENLATDAVFNNLEKSNSTHETVVINTNNNGSSLSDKESNEIIQNLKKYLTSDKLFNNKLREIDVAREIDTSKQKLTYVINHVMGSTFYGLINKYRILEAKRLLKMPEYQKYNIVVISEMVGFHSKSSFNSCFKKLTGTTPSGYRKNNATINVN